MVREATAEHADTPPSPRAPARRPRVVLVDVLETMLRGDTFGRRFVDVGRPAEDWRLDDTVIRLLGLPA